MSNLVRSPDKNRFSHNKAHFYIVHTDFRKTLLLNHIFKKGSFQFREILSHRVCHVCNKFLIFNKTTP